MPELKFLFFSHKMANLGKVHHGLDQYIVHTKRRELLGRLVNCGSTWCRTPLVYVTQKKDLYFLKAPRFSKT